MKAITFHLMGTGDGVEGDLRKLEAFICDISDRLVKYGIAINAMCEGEERHDHLSHKAIILLLVGTSVSDASLVTLEKAFESAESDGSPSPIVFFRDFPTDTVSNESVELLKERIDGKFGHHFTYDHVDTVKLALMTELSRDPDFLAKPIFENGDARLDDVVILSLWNTPIYAKNAKIRELWGELSDLSADYLDKAVDYVSISPYAFREHVDLIVRRRFKVLRAIHVLEIGILDLYGRASVESTPFALRIGEASRLILDGCYDEALDVLENEGFICDARKTPSLPSTPDGIRDYIIGERLCNALLIVRNHTKRISRTIDMGFFTLSGITDSGGDRMVPDALFDFAKFLFRDYRYTAATRSAYQYLRYLESIGCDGAPKASTLHLLGDICVGRGRLVKAESLFREALELYRRIASDSPYGYLSAIERIVIGLAGILRRTGRSEASESLYRELLTVLRGLASDKPSLYLPHVAKAAGELGNFLRGARRFEESEALYREAVEIYQGLAKDDPDDYLPMEANATSALAGLFIARRKYDMARSLLFESRDIYFRFNERKPNIYSIKIGVIDVVGKILLYSRLI